GRAACLHSSVFAVRRQRHWARSRGRSAGNSLTRQPVPVHTIPTIRRLTGRQPILWILCAPLKEGRKADKQSRSGGTDNQDRPEAVGAWPSRGRRRVAPGRATARAATAPGAATQHTPVVGARFRPLGVLPALAVALGVRSVPVRAPLPDVAVHVVQTQRIG